MALTSPRVRAKPARKLAARLPRRLPAFAGAVVPRFVLSSERPSQSRYIAPRYLITRNRLPRISASTDRPNTASPIKARSPRTIPAETATPLPTPNVADRVTTSATLVLGMAASDAMMPNRASISMRLIVGIVPVSGTAGHQSLSSTGAPLTVVVCRGYLHRAITHPFDVLVRRHCRREHDGLAEQRRMGLAAEGHEYVSVRDVECSHRAGPGIGGRRAHARLCAVGGE